MTSQEHTSGLADPQREPLAHAFEVVTTIEPRAIFKGEIRIVLIRPALDNAKVPDNASTLRLSTITRAPLRPPYTMPLRLIIDDELEVAPLHLQTTPISMCPKNAAIKRKNQH
jgi:hypothetical protein